MENKDQVIDDCAMCGGKDGIVECCICGRESMSVLLSAYSAMKAKANVLDEFMADHVEENIILSEYLGSIVKETEDYDLGYNTAVQEIACGLRNKIKQRLEGKVQG